MCSDDCTRLAACIFFLLYDQLGVYVFKLYFILYSLLTKVPYDLWNEIILFAIKKKFYII